MTDSIQTAKYTITGLVDIFDEQGNITGQFEIGSTQELPMEYGTRCVENGLAELVEGSEETKGVENVEAPTGDTGVDGGAESGDTTVETEVAEGDNGGTETEVANDNEEAVQ